MQECNSSRNSRPETQSDDGGGGGTSRPLPSIDERSSEDSISSCLKKLVGRRASFGTVQLVFESQRRLIGKR